MLECVPEIMTFNECKCLLKIGKNTLLNLLHNGDIGASKQYQVMLFMEIFK